MSKKEKIFPLNTVGGRIQNLRHAMGLSRSQLYDLVYEKHDTQAGSNSSKEKTVYNWESENTQLNYDTLKSMCRVLKCSSDYLLGFDECIDKTTQFIHQKTGLSQNAIYTLMQLNNLSKYFPHSQDDKYKVINLILSDQKDNNELSSLLEYLVGFCRFDIIPNNNYVYTVNKKGIHPFQYKESASGKGYSYNPLETHFQLQDMESMYYLKIWDAIKKLKQLYKKTPGTN